MVVLFFRSQQGDSVDDLPTVCWVFWTQQRCHVLGSLCWCGHEASVCIATVLCPKRASSATLLIGHPFTWNFMSPTAQHLGKRLGPGMSYICDWDLTEAKMTYRENRARTPLLSFLLHNSWEESAPWTNWVAAGQLAGSRAERVPMQNSCLAQSICGPHILPSSKRWGGDPLKKRLSKHLLWGPGFDLLFSDSFSPFLT